MTIWDNSRKPIDSYNHAVQLNRLQAKPSAWPHLDLAISLVESNRLRRPKNNYARRLDMILGFLRHTFSLVAFSKCKENIKRPFNRSIRQRHSIPPIPSHTIC